MSRAMELDSFHLLLKRARAHSFPLSKRARLFPSAAYRRSASAQLAWGVLTPCRLGSFNVVGGFCSVDEWAAFPFSGASMPLDGWDASVWLGYFCNAENQREIKSTLACIASHEARRRMAAYIRQPAGSRTKPASRGTCRATAVKFRPSRMSPEHPARPWRAVRGQGAQPLVRGLVRPSKRATMRKPARL